MHQLLVLLWALQGPDQAQEGCLNAYAPAANASGAVEAWRVAPLMDLEASTSSSAVPCMPHVEVLAACQESFLLVLPLKL